MRIRPRILLISLALAVACGGSGSDDDGDGGGDGDGDGDGDSADAATADAAPPLNALGTSCTAPEGAPQQADCPDGYLCIGFPGGTGTFCSQACTGQTDPTCDEDFEQAGLGVCFVAESEGAGPTRCGIVCNDAAGAPEVCTDCDGTCSGGMACTLDLGMGITGCR